MAKYALYIYLKAAEGGGKGTNIGDILRVVGLIRGEGGNLNINVVQLEKNQKIGLFF